MNLTAEDHERMAENCESAARRLAASDLEADRRDGIALDGAAAIHRAESERLEKEERAAQATRYWWQDRDE